ncbi:MAG: zinc ribbon domain-containing protein [Gemmatimonadetes bacterium]|nr:zinc ribbon domain-containing protein [Gemmatimonadota bacterium]
MADQLERLFRILVRRIRDVRPEHLSRPFEVADILRTFVPYRLTRADIDVDAAEDYEVLILRLLSGERGFIFADDVMQDDLRRELESGNPDLRALQAYGTAKVTLAQHAMRQVLEASPPAADAAAPAPPAGPTAASTAAASAPMEMWDTAARVGASPAHGPPPAPGAAPASEVSAAFEALQRQLPPTLNELGDSLSAVGSARVSFHPRASRIPDPTADSSPRTPRPGCRFCGQSLPEGRAVTFCPHCGQNLKILRCPGCSAELDPAWKFCVVCGRASTAV